MHTHTEAIQTTAKGKKGEQGRGEQRKSVSAVLSVEDLALHSAFKNVCIALGMTLIPN